VRFNRHHDYYFPVVLFKSSQRHGAWSEYPWYIDNWAVDGDSTLLLESSKDVDATGAELTSRSLNMHNLIEPPCPEEFDCDFVVNDDDYINENYVITDQEYINIYNKCILTPKLITASDIKEVCCCLYVLKTNVSCKV
jgi:hypothetical protein